MRKNVTLRTAARYDACPSELSTICPVSTTLLTDGDRARILIFDGARNVRDLGGLSTPDGRRVRKGMFYRADGLARLSDADLERLAGLELKSIIDLRYPQERARLPSRLPARNTPQISAIGVSPRGSMELFEAVNEHGADASQAFEIMRRNYGNIPHQHVREFRSVFAHLLEPENTPCLIHCMSGKDRTGIAVALVLRALGITLDTIVADYELSNTEHQPVDVFGPKARADAIEIIMAAHPDYIRASFDTIDERCGGFDAYFEETLGFSSREREALRGRLLEA